MEMHKFVANSPAGAVKQIKEKLGSNAVVVQVRPVETHGLRRLLGKQQIEVIAHVPESVDAIATEEGSPSSALIDRIPEDWLSSGKKGSTLGGFAKFYGQEANLRSTPQSGSVLSHFIQNSGLLPCFAEEVTMELEKSKVESGGTHTSQDEIKLFHRWMSSCWRASTPQNSCGIHLFIGSPGVGKSVVLAKWLSRAVLGEGLSARVIRLNGETANVAENLELHCEMLGVATSRSVEDVDLAPEDVVFIDLPGADLGNKGYQKTIKEIVKIARGAVQIHLVLNAAYDSLNLLRQCRAAEQLEDVDLIITRLDEEERWGKIWNLFLGTKFSLCYLNGGQNIPGDFMKPDLQAVLQQELPIKADQNESLSATKKVGKRVAKRS